MAEKKKNDASNLFPILRKRFPSSEYALMREVSDASGFNRSRSADYIAVGLWPSRGHYVTGIEVKSYRNDWLNELKNPKKAENIFQYCDFFYLVTTEESIAKLEEIPATWGWMTVRGNKMFTVKEAPQNTPIDIGKSFMCAMLKRACSNNDGLIHPSTIEERIEEAVERARQSAEHSWRREKEHYDDLKKDVNDFERASGIRMSSSWVKSSDLGKAVEFIKNGGLEKARSELERLHKSAESIVKSLSEHIILAKTELIDGSATVNIETDIGPVPGDGKVDQSA